MLHKWNSEENRWSLDSAESIILTVFLVPCQAGKNQNPTMHSFRCCEPSCLPFWLSCSIEIWQINKQEEEGATRVIMVGCEWRCS